jgi:di/tricarboxylate transporter
MNIDLILVFIAIGFILVSLYKNFLGTSFTFIIAVTFLGVFGVLTPEEILNGFANRHIAVIIMLLLYGDVLRKTGVIELIFDRIFESVKSIRGFMARMTFLVGGFSAFLNNTPIVAVMMPYINSWCGRKNLSPSKFLMPLSFAAILGGCITLIGTSTNLVVNGLVEDQNIIPELQPLGIFTWAYVGIPMLIIGCIYLIFFGYKLLPSRRDIFEDFSVQTRKYVVQAQVKNRSHLVGKTIAEAGLRNLKGLYLVEMIRKTYKIPAVPPDVVLDKGDILVFAGDTETIAELIKSNSGLAFTEVGMMAKKKRSEILEVVVSPNSTLINKTVKESNFRAKYDAAVISVHRNGERIGGKIGSVELKAGDVLLLFAGQDFYSRATNTQDFYFISKVRGFMKVESYKTFLLLAGLFIAIMLSAFKVIPLFIGLIVLLIASIVLNVADPKEVYKNIDYNLAIIIVLALALGVAMKKSGAAELVANSFINLFKPFGKIGLLVGIYIITSVLAAYITNKAAVAIIFPIALTIAKNMGANPIPFILALNYAAAACFITPIGYQTNLMVYGPGKYNFNDFMKIGLPLTIIYMIVSISILSIVYF